jgi:undecaprenyl-diphosphatase
VLPRRRETVDARLFLAVNHLPHTEYLDEQISLLSDLGKGVGWVAGGVWLGLRDRERGRRAALAAVGGMLAAVALVQGPIKAIFPRQRPFAHHLAIVVGKEPVDSSFPSGHTAGSFAAAAALAAFYPKDGPLLFLLASGVGASRVYLGHHFPSDVLIGAGLGVGVGGLATRLAQLGWRDARALLPVRVTAAGPGAEDGDGAGPQGAPAPALPGERRPLVDPQHDGC